MALSIEPEISGCSVVMLGDFNPAIVHPSWLHAAGAESDISDEITDIRIVTREISSFRIDTRTYTVMPDRFTLETSTAPWVAVADIIRQIFDEILVHTPIRGFGINRTVHFNVSSIEARTKIGRELAPIEPWGEFGSGMEPDDPSQIGGLLSLTMRRQKRLEAFSLNTNAKIEPSIRLSGNTGIFMEVNHHHTLSDCDQGNGARPAVEILADSFDLRVSEADSIINAIMERF